MAGGYSYTVRERAVSFGELLSILSLALRPRPYRLGGPAGSPLTRQPNWSILGIYTMSQRPKEPRKLRLDKPLMKIGGSLVVTLPNEVIQEWNLGKGDEVTLEVLDGAVRIEPKQPARLAVISEASLEEYARVLKGVQARVTMDTEAATLRIELLGADRGSVSTVLNNLWRNLPFLLRLLGLGSVKAPEPGEGRSKERKHGQTDDNRIA